MATKTTNKTKPKTAPEAKNSHRLKAPSYKKWRYDKRYKHPAIKLPSAWDMFKQSLKVLWRNKWLFTGIITIYGFLTILLVRGLSSSVNITTLKHALDTLGGGSSPLSNSVTLFGALVGTVASTSSQVGATYQSLLLLVISLVLIWALREVNNSETKNPVTVKQSFYQGLYPLAPFVLVLLVIAVQLIPLLIGGGIYSTVTNNALAITPVQRAIWGGLFFVLAVWSLYMIAASLFGLYIVTLPNMEPIKSLKTARKLVKYRRWTVLRKVLFLPVALLILAAVIMLPLLIFVTAIAQWAFFALSLFSLAVIHSYMYTLYKELL